MMEKEIFFVIIHVLLKTFLCEVRVYTDDDVYISNTSIPHTDIPSDCHLFGADFGGEVSTNNTVLNITTTTIFWIGATLRFKRNINPIGVIENCPENYEEDISLDECNLMCNDYKYFNFGEKSCTCKNDNMTDDTLFKTEPCEDGEKGLCSLEKCIVYQRVIEDEYYTCGTYKYISIYNSWIWILNFETCSEKKNYSYICDNGVLIHKPNKTWLNWREAYQICKDNGFNLINTTKGIQESEDSQTYWVSFFRKLKFYWGAHRTNDICVAGSIDENGTLTLVTKHCTESFPVLCHKINGMKDQRSNGASPSDVNIGMIVGICAAVVVLLAVGVIAVIVGCKRYKRIRKLQTVNLALNEADDATGVNDNAQKSDKAAAYGYSLSDAYSEPLHSVSKESKTSTECEYEQVGYKAKNVISNNKQSHIIENPYGNPYS